MIEYCFKFEKNKSKRLNQDQNGPIKLSNRQMGLHGTSVNFKIFMITILCQCVFINCALHAKLCNAFTIFECSAFE